MNDEYNLDSFHRQQLRTALHIKFPHVVSNSDLYQRTNEIPLTLTILKIRWKLFGHILRLLPQTPSQRSTRHYFPTSKSSWFRGRQRITIPITLNKDLVRASEHFNFSQTHGIQQFQSVQDLEKLIELRHDRQLWKHLCNDIFKAAQTDWSSDHVARKHYYLCKQKQSRSTKKLFDPKTTSKNDLNYVLTIFYVEVGKTNGSQYKNHLLLHYEKIKTILKRVICFF